MYEETTKSFQVSFKSKTKRQKIFQNHASRFIYKNQKIKKKIMHHYFLPKIKNPFQHLEKYEISLHARSSRTLGLGCIFCHQKLFSKRGPTIRT